MQNSLILIIDLIIENSIFLKDNLNIIINIESIYSIM